MKSSYIKGFFIFVAVVAALTLYVYTQITVRDLKDRQARSVTLWQKSLESAAKDKTGSEDLSLILEVVSNVDFPIIVTDTNMEPLPNFHRNVSMDSVLSDSAKLVLLKKIVREMDDANPPVRVSYKGLIQQYVHFGDSQLVRFLRLAPFVASGAVAVFVLIAYLSFSYIKRNEESSIWVGMSKETAHQLGTPISSLMGWLELLKSSSDNPERQAQIMFEMQADILRLNRVATRFSKIGSKTTVADEDVIALVEYVFNYYRQRIPQMGKNIELKVKESADIIVPINRELMEWVLENITKNAIDAIERGRGSISAEITEDAGFAYIDITDTGKGIEPRNRKDIFRPGFSTKARGWGLGLSLAKRIVEDYHKGKLFIKDTSIGKGTTFRIKLRKNL
ncbi:MAG: HAMP domain-containing histidine kinase [Rhizobacter sp.]|nr:HAMP domain-containing histidine kinase [Chlorobiales bacterium]